jgi:hypothetical protein
MAFLAKVAAKVTAKIAAKKGGASKNYTNQYNNPGYLNTHFPELLNDWHENKFGQTGSGPVFNMRGGHSPFGGALGDTDMDGTPDFMDRNPATPDKPVSLLQENMLKVQPEGEVYVTKKGKCQAWSCPQKCQIAEAAKAAKIAAGCYKPKTCYRRRYYRRRPYYRRTYRTYRRQYVKKGCGCK